MTTTQEWKHSTGSHVRTSLWPCRLWLAAADSPSNRYRGWTLRPESSSRCSDAAPAAGCMSSLWTPSAHLYSQLCWCPHDDRLWIKKIALNIEGNKCGWVLLPAAHTFVIHKGKNKRNPSIELKNYVPGPFPEASSFLSLLISSSVMVVMSLQKSTFFPCSSSMYTYQHNNTHLVG